MKQRKTKKGSVGKGAPSGLLISILFHGAVFFIAGLCVVFTVVNKSEPEFTPPTLTERPKMKLKKPKVKVNKSSKPKPSSRIVAKVTTKTLPEIQLPDLEGVGTGLMGGAGLGGEFLDLPDIENSPSLFGREDSTGTDFEGRLYQLSHSRSGGPASMNENDFRAIVREYVTKGWDESVLNGYYRFPKKLYTRHFMIPPIPSPMTPISFGAPDVECYYMFAVYKGKLVSHKDIKFRFWGYGDAYLFVNVDGKEVLVTGWANHCREYFNWWKSHAPNDEQYMFCNLLMGVGDWIELKAGEPVDMNVLFGEWKGGVMGAGLLVEVEGEDYPNNHWSAPLLPVFKTEELTWEDMTEISKHLPRDECSLTNGPVFNDFGPSPKMVSDYDRYLAEQAEALPEEDAPELHQWRFKNGNVVEAEFLGLHFDKVTLSVDGKSVRISPDQLCEEDQEYIRLCNPPELHVEFSRKSRQMVFPPELFADNLPPEGAFYRFTASIKQTSSKTLPYGYPLTAEIFAIGEQIMSDKQVLLEHRSETFLLSDENNFSFESSGREIQLFDYQMNLMRRGIRYGGYVVVIRDQQGTVVAHKESSKNLYRHLNNLSHLKEGWFFDDECVRCLPDQPPPWNPKYRNE